MVGITTHEACLADVAFPANPFCLTTTKLKPLRLAILNHENSALRRDVVRTRNCRRDPRLAVLQLELKQKHVMRLFVVRCQVAN